MLAKKGIVLMGILCMSMSSIFVRWSTAPSLILVVYRMGLAALLLLPGALRSRQAFMKLPRRTLLLCLCSGVALGVHFAVYFQAVRWTSVSASTLLVNIEVLFVALGSVVVFRKKLSGKAWLAIAVTLAGGAVVAMGGTNTGPNPLLGNFMALLAAFLMAIYTMIGSVCRKDMTTTMYTFLVYLIAAITVLFVALASGTPLAGYDSINYVTALGMTVFCTLLGHSILSWGLKYLSVGFIAIVKLLTCVFASAWALVLFAEYPNVQVYIGGVVVIAGIILYNKASEESNT